MADEIQDFNEIEFTLLTTIMPYIPETILLGDDDQCIYRFKGSVPDIAITAHKTYEVIEHHHICYRCPKSVVAAGKALLSHNANRIAKDWHSKDENIGDIKFVNKSNLQEMWTYIKNTIIKIKAQDPDVSFMILYPYGAFIDGLDDMLSKADVPCLIEEKEKISDIRLKHKMMAMWNENPHKALSIILYFILRIYRSRKQRIIDSLWKAIYENGISIDNLLKWGKDNEMEDIDKIATGRTKEQIIVESDGKITENFFNNNYYEDKPIFDKEKVNFLSIHKSKGLSTDYVFVVGLQQNILPRYGLGMAEYEEERRKLFVAITRGKKGLFLMASQSVPGHFLHKPFLKGARPVWNPDKTIRIPASPFIGEMGLKASID
jgi:DNA helicase-2/ATP-dependent DNA helicase PcrA